MKPTGCAVAARAVQAVGEGIAYRELDCQAFVEACVADCGGAMAYAGSNDMARNGVSWLGTLAEARAAGRLIPGAALFIHESNGGEPARYRADGLGNYSHVGLYAGANALTDTDRNGVLRACDAVHSSATMGRVAGTTLQNGWTHAGWFKAIDYGAGAAAEANASAQEAQAMQTAQISQTTQAAQPAQAAQTMQTVQMSQTAQAELGAQAMQPASSAQGASLAQPPSSAQAAPAQAEPDTALIGYVTAPSGSTVNLRRQRSVQSQLVTRLPLGTCVRVLALEADWACVRADGYTGYVRRKYLTLAVPGTANAATSANTDASAAAVAGFCAGCLACGASCACAALAARVTALEAHLGA